MTLNELKYYLKNFKCKDCGSAEYQPAKYQSRYHFIQCVKCKTNNTAVKAKHLQSLFNNKDIKVVAKSKSRALHKLNKKTDRNSILKACVIRGYIVKDNELEHRAIYKKAKGDIPKGYDIHHVNKIKNDNNIDNLVGIPHKLHFLLHYIEKRKGIEFKKKELLDIVAYYEKIHK